MVDIAPVVEFMKIERRKLRETYIVFSEKTEKSPSHKYLKGVRDKLDSTNGIYVFYDSRGRAIYVGKADKQTLWKELNSAFNRNRGGLQTIKSVKHPESNIEYKPYAEKERAIHERTVQLSDIASFFSAYSIDPRETISSLEALIVRALANDLLNKKMEKFPKLKSDVARTRSSTN